MQATPIRIFLILIILILICPSVLQAATEQRIALVIGNSAYSSGPLKNPVSDAAAMATKLQKLGFTVILKKNATLRVMEDALTDFGDKLKGGGVGLFFYAGHGLQVGGANYLVPIGARINRESDIKYETLHAGRILDEMGNASNGLNIVILDACRDNPYSRSFRNTTRGLAIVSNAPLGTFISYSTSPGNIAADGKGRNSPYTESLLKHMSTTDLPIEHVFKKVRQELNVKTNGRQIPWELSSLSGDFFFNSSGVKQKIQTAATDNTYQDDDLAEEKRKLAEENERLRREKELLEEKNALAETKRRMEEERRKLEAERQQLAIAKRSSQPTAGDRRIEGIYNVAGTNPNGTSYGGILTLTRNDVAYVLVWKIGSSTFRGTGNFQGEALVIDWGQSYPVIYKVAEDGRLIGTWNNGSASEVLTPVK